MSSADAKIVALLEATDAKPITGEVLWRMRSDDGRIDVTYGDQHRPFFIASATKLFVTAILAQLRTEGTLNWDQPIASYLPDLDLSGLSVAKGVDRSGEMTVREVMAHTAGLADYFEGRRSDGTTTMERAVAHDAGWDVRDVVAWTKQMKPGTPGKGLYSDTGYQLLGAAIERIDGRPFAESVQVRVADPLGLTDTYCFSPATLDKYGAIAPMRNGNSVLRIPFAMASVQADGGIVSTTNDALRFLDAFFDGRLFPEALQAELQSDWHRIFTPLEYGTGIMRFRLPTALTGFRRVPPFVGHSGASGTVMFRAPELGLNVVGTVNQVRKRDLPFQLMVRTTLAARPALQP